MKRLMPLIAVAAVVFAVTGCADHAYYAPPPPPPVVYVPSNALFDLASRNGVEIGARDGARDASYGYRPAPRQTPAYHDAPGYDPNLGPFGAYANTFRNAYLRGYDNGFYHR